MAHFSDTLLPHSGLYSQLTETPVTADKDSIIQETEKLLEELDEMQKLMIAGNSHGLLIILQGLDASGKDGGTKRICSALNPFFTKVTSFKPPTPDEIQHDFLWRVHKAVPGRGEIGIFNRSQYEDIIIPRITKSMKSDAIERRFVHINTFENFLNENGILILKFFLHVGEKEQKERLEKRETDRVKYWKLSPGDWDNRLHRKEFLETYEEIFQKTHQKPAPWFVIPADKKWYRDYCLLKVVVETLSEFKNEWLKETDENHAKSLAALKGIKRK